MRKLYLIWLHILSLQFAFTTCCTDLYLQLGAKSREPRAMGHEPFPFPLIPSLQAFGILCWRMLEIILYVADVHSVFAAAPDIMHCFCFLCICQKGNAGVVARHLHATYEINYYALSPPPKNSLFLAKIYNTKLCSFSFSYSDSDSGSGIGIACPAHSNFQGTVLAFRSPVSRPSPVHHPIQIQVLFPFLASPSPRLLWLITALAMWPEKCVRWLLPAGQRRHKQWTLRKIIGSHHYIL